MRAVASGDRNIPGLSPAQAEEYVAGHPTKGLPSRKHKKNRKKAKRHG